MQVVAQPNSFFQVFELNDAAEATPLTVRTESGLTDTKVPVGALPVLPDVYVQSPNFSHKWKSGTLVFRRDSQDAKDKAVADAVTAAQSAVGAVTSEVERVAATGAFKGDPGQDGANVIPTAQAIAAEVQKLPPRPLVSALTPNEVIANALDFGVGELRIALASDSTWNDSNDMPRKWGIRLGQIAPTGFGVYEKQFNATTQEYRALETVKAGQVTPATGGVVLFDTFDRTAAELVGSATSGGQTWAGTAGSWSVNGTHAISTNGPKGLAYNTGSASTTLTAVLDVVTAAGTVAPNVRACVGSTTATFEASDFMVFAQLAVSTGGQANLSVFKRNGTNAATQIVSSDFATGLVANQTTPQKVTVTIKLAIQNVTVTVTPSGGTTKTYTATISEAEYGSLGGFAGVTMANNASSAIRVDSVQMEIPSTPGSYSGIEIWNGAVGGANLPYQQTRLELLYPAATKFDILAISGGHNKSTVGPEAFVAEVDAFIQAFKAVHPEILILVSSQNPQKAPSTTVVAHARQQAALRAYAMDKGYEYLPVFEAFTAQPDKGLSMILNDGIHPTYPGSPEPLAGLGKLDWSGAVLWASVWLQAINSRRIANATPLSALPTQ